MNKLMTESAIFIFIATSSAAFADDMSGMKVGDSAMAHIPASNTAMTEAVVRHVDPTGGTITLKHGALPNVGMPAMTMAFKAKDPAMLKEVKEGDNVKVRVEKVNGTPTIVKLEKP
ncbi:Cu/Ag efflux protein CusF [Paraburkholderia sp. BL8N3]|nr:Cu/Ag efflux protein CusF [Paraburkholderia sp. BL8N3]